MKETPCKPTEASEPVRCAAHCRTTCQPCKNFSMPNGRCRMHGGKSSGRPAKHGFYSIEAVAERRQLKALAAVLRALSRPKTK